MSKSRELSTIIYNSVTSVHTISTLRATVGVTDRESYLVEGYDEVGDGGGGIFIWDPSSTLMDDGGLVIRPSSIDYDDPGRWLRLYDKGPVHAAWFGCVPREVNKTNGDINRAALIRALSASSHVKLPSGRIPLTGPIRVTGKSLTGAGAHTIVTPPAEYGTEIIDLGKESSEVDNYLFWCENIRTLGTREKGRHWRIADFLIRKDPSVNGEPRIAIRCSGSNFGIYSRLSVVDYNGYYGSDWPNQSDIAFDLSHFDFDGWTESRIWTEKTVWEDISVGNSRVGFLLRNISGSGSSSYNFCEWNRIQMTHMPLGPSGASNDGPSILFAAVRREISPGVFESAGEAPNVYQGCVDLTAYISPIVHDGSNGEHLRAIFYNDGCSFQQVLKGLKVTGEAVGGSIYRWARGATLSLNSLVIPSSTIATGYQYRVQKINSSGKSGTIEPSWPTGSGVYVADRDALWVADGTDPAGSVVWSPNTTYTEGDRVRPTSWTSGKPVFVFPANVAATQDTEPNWPTVLGNEVTEGRITYRCVPGVWGFYNKLSTQYRAIYDNVSVNTGIVAIGTRHFFEKLPYDAKTTPYNNVLSNPSSPSVPNDINTRSRSTFTNINGKVSFGPLTPQDGTEVTISAFTGTIPLTIDVGGSSVYPPIFYRAVSNPSEGTTTESIPVWYTVGDRDAEILKRRIPVMKNNDEITGSPRYIGGIYIGSNNLSTTERLFSCRTSSWQNGETVKRGDYRFINSPSPGGTVLYVCTTSGVIGVDAVIKSVATASS